MKLMTATAEQIDGAWEQNVTLTADDTRLLQIAIKLLAASPGDTDDSTELRKIITLKDTIHEAWKRTHPS
jgi:hypothetical protein